MGPAPIKTYVPGRYESNTAMREVKRGQIYYVAQGKDYMNGKGSSRQAIIVSGETVNRSYRCMVVYLTKQNREREDHVAVEVNGEQSYAICDNINTIYKDRLKGYAGTVTEDEMRIIDREMAKSLNLIMDQQKDTPAEDWKDKPLCIGCTTEADFKAMTRRAQKAEQEMEFYKRAYEELLGKVMDRV